ncbi:MAG TPA: GxxExxY protein [Candidatus Hydrogenedentes bacterium]|nr:GxxExxY protein [Candidatus Hydrogenedentota bacterium]HQH53809.1 GxxExxY protein [Candidatus Hydrogenedentota bacterium]
MADCAVALHRETGPGLLDTMYEAVLARDLEARGLRTARSHPYSFAGAISPVSVVSLCEFPQSPCYPAIRVSFIYVSRGCRAMLISAIPRKR